MHERILRVATHIRTSSTKVVAEGELRQQYADAAWAMYQRSYGSIGMGLKSKADLFKYPVWWVFMGESGPVAFRGFKKNQYGLKASVMAHDGSAGGKSSTVNAIRSSFKEPGVYGEASHAVEGIAIAAGAPAVCPKDAQVILGKDLTPSADGIRYTRNITGVGPKEKIMLGNPVGVSTTDPNAPTCDINNPGEDDQMEMVASDLDAGDDDGVDDGVFDDMLNLIL